MLLGLLIYGCNEALQDEESLKSKQEQEAYALLKKYNLPLDSKVSFYDENDIDQNSKSPITNEVRFKIRQNESSRSCNEDCSYNVFDCGLTYVSSVSKTGLLGIQQANLFYSYTLRKATSGTAPGSTAYYQITNLSITKYGSGSLHIQKAFNINLAQGPTTFNAHRNYYDGKVIDAIIQFEIFPDIVSNNHSGYGNVFTAINKYCYAQCNANWVPCGQGCISRFDWIDENPTPFQFDPYYPYGDNGACPTPYSPSQYCPSNQNSQCINNDPESSNAPN
jgi:hypothetical protein